MSIVDVAGQIDLLTVHTVRRHVDGALSRSPAALVIDFTDVDFLSSAGLGMLVAVRATTPEAIPIAVVADGPATSRPIKLIGVDAMVPLYATRDEAVAALEGAQRKRA